MSWSHRWSKGAHEAEILDLSPSRAGQHIGQCVSSNHLCLPLRREHPPTSVSVLSGLRSSCLVLSMIILFGILSFHETCNILLSHLWCAASSLLSFASVIGHVLAPYSNVLSTIDSYIAGPWCLRYNHCFSISFPIFRIQLICLFSSIALLVRKNFLH